MTVDSIFNKAIELLFDKMAFLEEQIARIESTDGKTQLATGLKQTVNAITYTINYLQDLERLVYEDNLLRYRNQSLEKTCCFLINELQKYKVIERMRNSGELEETIAVVITKMNNEKDPLV